MTLRQKVQSWFNEKGGGALLLPDGWYGRPYDNKHLLTSIDEVDKTLIVVLDKKLILRFEGLQEVKAQSHELTIGPFEKMVFDWKSFGIDGNRGTVEYQSGEVKIVVRP